eukprot:CFRG2530T1
MVETTFVNNMIFPAPRPPSYNRNSFSDRLIFLRSDYTAAKEFPCVFITARPPHQHIHTSTNDRTPLRIPECTRVILYLHGNAEDLGIATDFFEQHICDEINSHVLIVEYPGYGICIDDEPSSRGVKQHTWIAYRFLLSLGFIPSDIVVYGRSIGTGAALSLVSTLAEIRHSPPAGVVLLSPFTSLVKMVYDYIGPIAYALAERFDNYFVIQQVECPLLVVHGLKDELISPYHSQELFDMCPSAHKHLLYLPDADHNTFDPSDDIARPLRMFCNAYTIPRKNCTPSNSSTDIHNKPAILSTARLDEEGVQGPGFDDRREQMYIKQDRKEISKQNEPHNEVHLGPSHRKPDLSIIKAMARAHMHLSAKIVNTPDVKEHSGNSKWASSWMLGMASAIATTIYKFGESVDLSDDQQSPPLSPSSNYSKRNHASFSLRDADSIHNTTSLGSGGGAYGLIVDGSLPDHIGSHSYRDNISQIGSGQSGDLMYVNSNSGTQSISSRCNGKVSNGPGFSSISFHGTSEHTKKSEVEHVDAISRVDEIALPSCSASATAENSPGRRNFYDTSEHGCLLTESQDLPEIPSVITRLGCRDDVVRCPQKNQSNPG